MNNYTLSLGLCQCGFPNSNLLLFLILFKNRRVFIASILPRGPVSSSEIETTIKTMKNRTHLGHDSFLSVFRKSVPGVVHHARVVVRQSESGRDVVRHFVKVGPVRWKRKYKKFNYNTAYVSNKIFRTRRFVGEMNRNHRPWLTSGPGFPDGRPR